MLRPRLLLRRDKALAFGIGGSTGPHKQGYLRPSVSGNETAETTHYRWQRANWVNLEVGYEWRRDNGFVFRPVFGLAFLTNPDSAEVFEPVAEDHYDLVAHSDRQTMLLYAGVGVGYAL